MNKIWKFIIILFAILLIGCCVKYSRAEGSEESEEGVEVFIFQLAPPTPTPEPIPVPTPEPTPIPDPAKLPSYTYDDGEARCLARAMWSLTGYHVGENTKLALCEVIQNRVDYEGDTFPDTIRYVLLQGRGSDHPEFDGYDPKAKITDTNEEIAAYAMRAWIHAQKGDRSYRIVPENGVRYDIIKVNNKDYIRVYDIDWNVVYENIPERWLNGNS